MPESARPLRPIPRGPLSRRLRLLRPRDFDLLQQAILQLNAERDIEGFRKAVPGIFFGVIRADYFSLGDARLDDRTRSGKVLNLWESRPVRVGRLFEALERSIYDHPFTRYTRRYGRHGAFMLSDFMTLRQLKRTALYREALGPAGIGRMLTIGSTSGPGLAWVSLARPETAPDFGERDRVLLELISPHFDQARRNIEREAMLRASRSYSLRASGLTPREMDVALWLAQGKSNQEIGVILTTPVRTVEKHVERILAKLGVENRAAAAVMIAGTIRS